VEIRQHVSFRRNNRPAADRLALLLFAVPIAHRDDADIDQCWKDAVARQRHHLPQILPQALGPLQFGRRQLGRRLCNGGTCDRQCRHKGLKETRSACRHANLPSAPRASEQVYPKYQDAAKPGLPPYLFGIRTMGAH
jgi:hypothetical protein